MSGEVEIETGPGSGAKRAWWRRLSPDAWGWVGLGAFLSVFVWLWFYLGTHLIYQSNQDRLNWDQQHNIAMAFKALDREKQPLQPGETVTEALWRSFPHYTDGVVNPLWPWVAARFATEDHEAFFRRGKWFNLIVTMVFLVALGVVTARAFSLPSAIAVLLLAGLGGMLPRAPYFQPEPIYYILLFLAWAAALSLLRKNHLWLYGLIGGLLGLAYLAKTSVQPFLLVFFGVTLLRTLVAWWTGRRKADRGDSDGWSVPNQFIGLAVL
ncbi:MAG: hypothetical protein KDM91_22660, partial [Verrucomicrobiae bacterium]|nr:hypothetical protein [Verrucomicrobiae bacterium]